MDCDCGDCDCGDQLADLGKRLTYIERELDLDYHRNQFQNQMERAFPNASVTVRNEAGLTRYSAKITDIWKERLRRSIADIEDRGYEWETDLNEEGDLVVLVYRS